MFSSLALSVSDVKVMLDENRALIMYKLPNVCMQGSTQSQTIPLGNIRPPEPHYKSFVDCSVNVQ